MPVHNADISEIFSKMADMLELEGANQFRVRAYRNAARIIGDSPQRISDMAARGEDLTQLPGIGKDLAGKIKEIVETGALSQLKELEARTPADLNKLMKIAGLGPKRVYALYRELGISTAEELKAAASAGKIRLLEGFGEKTEGMILEYFARRSGESEARMLLPEAEDRAVALAAYLKGLKGVKDLTISGSYRRRKETVGDLDILATCKKGTKVMDHFVRYENVQKIISKGETRSTVRLRSGLQVDLRLVPQVSYGAALHYFTGSQAHNIAVRKLGVKKNLKINEYGVFKGDRRIAGRREEEVFRQVGLPFIPPELRENWGEIEAAQRGELPRLIELDEIVGDLHAHTKETDGLNSLEEMAEAARDRGYGYLAITEHSKRVSMAHGLDVKRLRERNERIDRLNEELAGIVLLKSIEVDILKDGELDLPDDVLQELDLTVCSVHYNTNLTREKQTERIIRAMDNPHFNILAHPTGRIINKREPYEVDLEAVMKSAVARGCFMELNAHPQRLDLTDRFCKMAKDMGLKVAISTDAHRIDELDLMRYGVDQARRGWLEAGDVLNTRGWGELKELLKR